MALTVDIPLLRLGGGDPWSVIALRSVCTLLVLIVFWFALKKTGRNPPALFADPVTRMVGVLYALTGLCFMLAVFITPTANLVFILALNPMLAALMGRVFLGERLSAQTLAALAVMIFGVFLIVRDGLVAGNLTGHILSFLAALALACSLSAAAFASHDHKNKRFRRRAALF